MAIPPSPPAQQVPRARKVAIVCHQGANEYAPPNTVAAAQLCIDWGMDYVEIDVNMSRDGVLYVFHGPDLAETTDGRGLFHEQSAATLDALDAGSWFDARYRGERVPRLDAYLRWIAGKAKVFFDVKRADLPQLIALVEAVQLEQDSFFGSANRSGRWNSGAWPPISCSRSTQKALPRPSRPTNASVLPLSNVRWQRCRTNCWLPATAAACR